jgi:hypothetical protein
VLAYVHARQAIRKAEDCVGLEAEIGRDEPMYQVVLEDHL